MNTLMPELIISDRRSNFSIFLTLENLVVNGGSISRKLGSDNIMDTVSFINPVNSVSFKTYQMLSKGKSSLVPPELTGGLVYIKKSISKDGMM